MASRASAVPALPIDVRVMNAAAALLVAGLAALLLAAVAWWALRNPAFAITQITVTGDTEHNTPATLRAALADRIQGNFFTLDLAAVRGAFETVPWVSKAVVRREFPNQLAVQLSEHVPVARWGGDGAELVDRYGAVFQSGGAEAGGLPLLAGPDGQSALVLELYRALTPVARDLDTTLAVLELQPRGHWRLALASGAEVELGLGTPAELTARFTRFAATAATVAARYQRGVADIESADLRYRQGYAIRLAGVNTVAAQP